MVQTLMILRARKCVQSGKPHHGGSHREDEHRQGPGLHGNHRGLCLHRRSSLSAWYSGVESTSSIAFANRAFGDYAWAYWAMMSLVQPALPAALLDPKSLRRNTHAHCSSFRSSTNIGMWFERFVITVTSPPQRLPAVELGLLLADDRRHPDLRRQLRLFFTLFLLFVASWRSSPSARSRASCRRPIRTPVTATGEVTEMSQYHAVIAEFESAAAIYKAAKETTDAGYTRVDAFTPFPVHGLDRALKQKDSPLGWLVIVGGATGLALSQLMMWWMERRGLRPLGQRQSPYWWPSTVRQLRNDGAVQRVRRVSSACSSSTGCRACTTRSSTTARSTA